MPEPDLSLLFVRPLNQLGIRYMVGSTSVAIPYGELIDRPALNDWLRRRGVAQEWERVQK